MKVAFRQVMIKAGEPFEFDDTDEWIQLLEFEQGTYRVQIGRWIGIKAEEEEIA